ncbi:MAG: hypothetical protein EOO52_16095 [Gammaproteobacteria bacterium]|nr:MAG: hypothetical protein EOO52_16095 [Gammaproteobacteria bacterium]
MQSKIGRRPILVLIIQGCIVKTSRQHLRSAGLQMRRGRLSFGYFYLAKQIKVTRQQAKKST